MRLIWKYRELFVYSIMQFILRDHYLGVVTLSADSNLPPFFWSRSRHGSTKGDHADVHDVPSQTNECSK